MTSPPTTAVKRVDFRRQKATKMGARKWDSAKLQEPIQTERERKRN